AGAATWGQLFHPFEQYVGHGQGRRDRDHEQQPGPRRNAGGGRQHGTAQPRAGGGGHGQPLALLRRSGPAGGGMNGRTLAIALAGGLAMVVASPATSRGTQSGVYTSQQADQGAR